MESLGTMVLKRPCIVVGCNTPTIGPRCDAHTKRKPSAPRESSTARGLGAAHRRIRDQVLAEETTCWLCGGPPTADNPLEADHIVPRSKGGKTERSNYRAAHATCNRSRGNRTTETEPPEPYRGRYAVGG
jgi:5-methylcytosine-specific restriction endonuclease McrA